MERSFLAPSLALLLFSLFSAWISILNSNEPKVMLIQENWNCSAAIVIIIISIIIVAYFVVVAVVALLVLSFSLLFLFPLHSASLSNSTALVGKGNGKVIRLHVVQRRSARVREREKRRLVGYSRILVLIPAYCRRLLCRSVCHSLYLRF